MNTKEKTASIKAYLIQDRLDYPLTGLIITVDTNRIIADGLHGFNRQTTEEDQIRLLTNMVCGTTRYPCQNRIGKKVIDMRMLYGMLAGVLWVFLLAMATAQYGAEIPSDIQWLTTAIVVAGAMAGGD